MLLPISAHTTAVANHHTGGRSQFSKVFDSSGERRFVFQRIMLLILFGEIFTLFPWNE